MTSADEESEPQESRQLSFEDRVLCAVGGILSPKKITALPDQAKKVILPLLDKCETLEQEIAELKAEREALKEEVRITGRIDLRTGFPNDVACAKEIQDMLAKIKPPYENDRRMQHPDPIVALIDVNGLKKINDTYTHVAGDKVIDRITEVLKEAKQKGILRGADPKTGREADYVARGGQRSDEFTLILYDRDGDVATNLMKKLISDISKQPVRYETPSGGYHMIPVSACSALTRVKYGDTIDDVRHRVSSNLTRAKHKASGRVGFPKPTPLTANVETDTPTSDDHLLGRLPGAERLIQPTSRPDEQATPPDATTGTPHQDAQKKRRNRQNHDQSPPLP